MIYSWIAMEFFPIIVLGLGGLGLLVWAAHPITPTLAACVACLLLMTLAGVWSWMQAPPKAGSPEDPATARRPIEVAEGGYVSSDTCQSCHPAEYASWRKSYHRTMTQIVTPETMLANWDGISLEVRNKAYHLERRGDQYWVDMVDPEFDRNRRFLGKLAASDNQTRRTQKRIVQATGSHHQQVFWFPGEQGRQLHLLPATWLVKEKRWIPYDHSLLRPIANVEVTEDWNAVCIGCHATGGQPRIEVSRGVPDSHVGELGIACEACHGPANQHVERHRNPLTRYAQHFFGGDDPEIVNPAKLDALRSAQVCGQCHSVTTAVSDQEQKGWSSSGSSFRPGDRLHDTRTLFRRPVDAGELGSEKRFALDTLSWSDGMIRVAGRDYHGLLASPCFKSDDFTCLSCHSMHTYDDRAGQLAVGMGENRACLQCHSDLEQRSEAHTRHAADSPASLCYNCHMPYTTYGLLKSIRSHTVSSPNIAESLEHGRPNACNLCHLDQTLAWTDRELVDGWGVDPTFQTGMKSSKRSAAATWLLEGDAGQRALIAWAMGWEPSQRASGLEWMAPLLVQLLEDPYRAVRFIARRSLSTLPGMSEIDVEASGPSTVKAQVMLSWRSRVQAGLRPSEKFDRVYLTRAGDLDGAAVRAALSNRDDRPVNLAE
jgi:hypothetical protein